MGGACRRSEGEREGSEVWASALCAPSLSDPEPGSGYILLHPNVSPFPHYSSEQTGFDVTTYVTLSWSGLGRSSFLREDDVENCLLTKEISNPLVMNFKSLSHIHTLVIYITSNMYF